MTITDKCNQTARMYEIQVTVIYSRAILVVVTSECRVKRVICKTWTGTLANSADPDQTPQNAAYDQVLHCCLELQEIKGSMKVLNPCSGPFFQPTLRQSTHQCWQCFGFGNVRIRVFKFFVSPTTGTLFLLADDSYLFSQIFVHIFVSISVRYSIILWRL